MKEFFVKLGIAAVAALAPIHAVLVSVGVLVFVDIVTGVWSAKKQGQAISSARLRDSVTKLLIYQVLIITGFLVETHLIEGLIPIVKIAAGLIVAVEFVSVLENMNKILGNDMFQIIIDKLGSKNAVRKKRVKRKKK